MTPILAWNLMEDEERPAYPDAAKAFVIAEFSRLVEEGRAVVAMLEAGTLEFRLDSGEVFHLGAEAITRIV